MKTITRYKCTKPFKQGNQPERTENIDRYIENTLATKVQGHVNPILEKNRISLKYLMPYNPAWIEIKLSYLRTLSNKSYDIELLIAHYSGSNFRMPQELEKMIKDNNFQISETIQQRK